MTENKKRGSSLLYFKVPGDGTWFRRGTNQLYGTAALIAYYTCEVTDLMICSCFLSIVCILQEGDRIFQSIQLGKNSTTKQLVEKTHVGSSGSMKSIKNMFLGFEELCGVKYVNYIDDRTRATVQVMSKNVWELDSGR